MARFIDFWNGPNAWTRTSPRLRAGFTLQLGQVINNLAASANESWALKAARSVSCPTLAIMGVESVPQVQRVTEMIAETVPQAQLAMIPGAGHMSPLTDPHMVDPLISGHLRTADRSVQLGAERAETYSLRHAA